MLLKSSDKYNTEIRKVAVLGKTIFGNQEWGMDFEKIQKVVETLKCALW